ncbi:hypothetical protein EC973_000341 [Apophysomyces ossiformis]|uniref:Tyr recombinase domain-containing protein n=1 Tax=Apophysomyces ossiformis TaxID=679940 RepID=A0A8H7EJI6_9FUNG|nr:hypothetical protein EC973_000341 [Apophysomyces ossiformis]
MAAFLRPSDLHRIQLQQSRVDEEDRLHLSIYAPKETRGGRRIIKTLIVHPLPSDPSLCPVKAYVALRDHPDARLRPPDSLLVNSVDVAAGVQVATISGWLRRLLAKSLTDATSSAPSVRSVASDLALLRGAALEDVLTMGNWSSSTVFDTHYRRTRQLAGNISARVLQAGDELQD